MKNKRLFNDSETYHRVFVALKIPNNVLQRIESINRYIDDRLVKKVKSRSFHLRLYFCGKQKYGKQNFYILN